MQNTYTDLRRHYRWLFTSLVALVLLVLMPPAKADDTGSNTLALDTPDETLLGDFPEMLARRQIRVLVVYSRTFYFIDKGQQLGLAYETMQAFAEQLNKKHRTGRLPIKFIYIPVHRDDLIPALIEGRGDIASANLTITDRRLEKADFADPFVSNIAEVLVQGPNAKPITQLEQLAGQTVYVRQTSSYYDSLLLLNQRFEEQGLDSVQLKLAPNALEDEDLMQLAASGLVDNLVVDQHKADLWQKVLPKLNVRTDVRLREDGQIAWMLRQNSPLLQAEINAFVATQTRKNKDRNWRIIKYLKRTGYINNTQSQEARQRFDRTIELFRQYSSQYDADYLLMMAQAYQESRLNQSARSHAGAIGIMQLLPSTGKAMGVGDIRNLEANIHAGVKYVRHIAEQYFNDPAIDSLNRHLFSFAGYNAGPNRIQRLRKLAAKRGLDPNVWHNNVERVVAEKVGRETVNYVANIYAYYIAYTLAVESTGTRRELREELKAQ
ncbi:transglycosylase SLT domain-containing protein [Atopomonas sediminilitoris]|uniref:transglycosylase SLT domain-containing protein n=1 Tax=Atopomonas sediminilitoris TaxID=2919919 RepID=UPI001F4E4221|nr:transporter substrate-binding domain-containing protein [Atopomonas sediminilitoris]MCJ8168895.1 transporter substrate-binding domain-containing protein [Atopomonas sediminilitoris]